MQKRRMPGRCPVCGDQLGVVRLRCDNCETSIEGSFETCKFCQLTREQQEFIEVFLKARGNIKEVERELGISYPTVRGRLDNVLEGLGYRVEAAAEESAAPAQRAGRRKEVLDALNRGEITSEDAVRLLKQQG